MIMGGCKKKYFFSKFDVQFEAQVTEYYLSFLLLLGISNSSLILV